MKTWTIEIQIEKTGKMETEVACKHVKHFPSMKGGKVTFGRFKKPILRVLITDGEKTHKITWSNHFGQTGPQAGKFVYRQESKWVYPPIKGLRKQTAKNVTGVWEDTLSPKIEKQDEGIAFESHETFIKWFSEKPYIGPELANEIMDAFAGRIVDFLAAA